jgi:DNA-binding transcriptional regulator YdaS (Cro superfamily)
MTMTKRELKQITDALGGVRAAANNLGVTTQAVHGWFSGDRPIPERRAEQLRRLIEMAQNTKPNHLPRL